MKRISLINIFILFNSIICLSQAYDANWLIGNGGGTGYNNCIVHFDSTSSTSIAVNANIPLVQTNACISDSIGNLLFITNGINLYDSTFNQIAGGQLVQNQYTAQYIQTGLNQPQQAIFIPYPGDTNKFVLFYTTKEYLMPTGAGGWVPFPLPTHLYYTVLDKSLNGGLGGVLSANNIAISDTLSQSGSGLAVVKHANGRDYWIIVKKHYKNIYHKFLLTPSGLNYEGNQAIGPNNQFFLGAPSIFSPDGTIYGQSRGNYDIFLFHFDRCTGNFTDYLHLLALDPSGLYGCEQIVFSANSRYLYASTGYFISQFDLLNYNTSGAVQNSAMIVAYSDSDTTACAPLNFPVYYSSAARLALNNKIYISSTHSCDRLSTIEFPDSAGWTSNVVTGNFPIASPNAGSVPYFTNYKLGPLVGSGCDTLTVGIQEPIKQVSLSLNLYPNPATTEVKVEINSGNIYKKRVIKIETPDGRLILAKTSENGSILIDVSNFSNGLYFLTVSDKTTIKSIKFIVVHE
ncbi:hypothetical protein BH11BAC2_BH11BAC2_07100 [soil metagenome]